jgi:hypothetical protein
MPGRGAGVISIKFFLAPLINAGCIKLVICELMVSAVWPGVLWLNCRA